MPKLKNILVIHTTSNEPDASTNAEFTLEIVKSSGTPVSKEFSKKDLLHPDKLTRQPGELDLFHFDVSTSNINSDESGFRIAMKIKTGNAWLPRSIFVLGHTDTGDIILLGYHPRWGSDTRRTAPLETTRWFDVGPEQPLIGIDTRVISS
jgi:hypothetical protein